jgi:hypothetical protein
MASELQSTIARLIRSVGDLRSEGGQEKNRLRPLACGTTGCDILGNEASFQLIMPVWQRDTKRLIQTEV